MVAKERLQWNQALATKMRKHVTTPLASQISRDGHWSASAQNQRRRLPNHSVTATRAVNTITTANLVRSYCTAVQQAHSSTTTP